MLNLSRYKKLKLDPQAQPQNVYLYSLYDRAANFFDAPGASMCTPEQMLLKARRDAMNGVFHYPNDLVLYLVGIFDSRNGRIIDANTYEVGSLYIGDFARKETVKQNGNVQNEDQGA